MATDKKYTMDLLREAMELLDDMHNNLSMFQRQRYADLKKRFDQQSLIGESLQTALNNIDTQ